MTLAVTLQGFILLLPLIGFSILAFWRIHPVLFMITAGIAIMTGLYIPDILTGVTSTPLSLSIGLLVVMYAFVCVSMAYRTLFTRGGDNGTES